MSCPAEAATGVPSRRDGGLLPGQSEPVAEPTADEPLANHERTSHERASDRLSARIHDRIQKRLGARIHDLRVEVGEQTIRLEGRCATYYSKQLAQHAALGVIEDEQLENAIRVEIAR